MGKKLAALLMLCVLLGSTVHYNASNNTIQLKEDNRKRDDTSRFTIPHERDRPGAARARTAKAAAGASRRAATELIHVWRTRT